MNLNETMAISDEKPILHHYLCHPCILVCILVCSQITLGSVCVRQEILPYSCHMHHCHNTIPSYASWSSWSSWSSYYQRTVSSRNNCHMHHDLPTWIPCFMPWAIIRNHGNFLWTKHDLTVSSCPKNHHFDPSASPPCSSLPRGRTWGSTRHLSNLVIYGIIWLWIVWFMVISLTICNLTIWNSCGLLACLLDRWIDWLIDSL